MINCFENRAIAFDRYYTRVNEISLNQLELSVRTLFKFEKILVQLVNKIHFVLSGLKFIILKN